VSSLEFFNCKSAGLLCVIPEWAFVEGLWRLVSVPACKCILMLCYDLGWHSCCVPLVSSDIVSFPVSIVSWLARQALTQLSASLQLANQSVRALQERGGRLRHHLPGGAPEAGAHQSTHSSKPMHGCVYAPQPSLRIRSLCTALWGSMALGLRWYSQLHCPCCCMPTDQQMAAFLHAILLPQQFCANVCFGAAAQVVLPESPGGSWWDLCSVSKPDLLEVAAEIHNLYAMPHAVYVPLGRAARAPGSSAPRQSSAAAAASPLSAPPSPPGGAASVGGGSVSAGPLPNGGGASTGRGPAGSGSLDGRDGTGGGSGGADAAGTSGPHQVRHVCCRTSTRAHQEGASTVF